MDNKKKNSFQRFREKLAPMDWPQRLEYIWNYHKETIIISATMLVIVIYMLSALIANQKPMLMGGLLANVRLSEEGKAYLSQGYMEYREGNQKKETVDLFTVELGDLRDQATMEQTYYGLTKTIAMLTDSEVDYLLMDKTALELYMAQGVFLDLREVLPEELLHSMEDKLISLKPVDENGKPVGEAYPVGVDISHLPFIKTCTQGQSPVYLGVAANSPNLEEIALFWDYINAWEESP